MSVSVFQRKRTGGFSNILLPLLILCFLFQPVSAQRGIQKQRADRLSEEKSERDAPFDSGQAFKAKTRLDMLFLASLRSRKIEPASICSDEVFIRRIYLDLMGTLPRPQEVQDFLENRSKDKRVKLIDKLLQQQEFVDFQTMRWSDLFRVKAEFPINLWPNGAACYYRWIHRAVEENRPYDQFVRELLTASGSNFRDGAANFYRAVPLKDAGTLAETVARTFLGIDTAPWPEAKQKQLAVFFSRVAYKESAQWKEEIVYWNRKPLESNQVVFPDGSEKIIDLNQDPREIFADWLLSPENKTFNQNIVNRIWIWLFGSGLIPDPENTNFDPTPVHPELLDYLSAELVRSKYDLKHLYRLILNSNIYQQSSIPASNNQQASVFFASYPIRRIEAEVLQDIFTRIFDLPLGYVSEVPEPFTYIPPRYRTVLLPDSSITSSFLEMFGRASRDTGTDADRNSDVTESQQLFLLNSTEVNSWVSRFLQKYRQMDKNPGAIKKMLDEIWLTFLSRYPTEAELRIAADEFRRLDKQGNYKAQDIVWSLINTKEFLCKH